MGADRRGANDQSLRREALVATRRRADVRSGLVVGFAGRAAPTLGVAAAIAVGGRLHAQAATSRSWVDGARHHTRPVRVARAASRSARDQFAAADGVVNWTSGD